MVHDVLEALNKSGFNGYNKEIEEFIQLLIQNNNEKNKGSKKKENKRTEIENDKDIQNEENIKIEKEKIIWIFQLELNFKNLNVYSKYMKDKC